MYSSQFTYQDLKNACAGQLVYYPFNIMTDTQFIAIANSALVTMSEVINRLEEHDYIQSNNVMFWSIGDSYRISEDEKTIYTAKDVTEDIGENTIPYSLIKAILVMLNRGAEPFQILLDAKLDIGDVKCVDDFIATKYPSGMASLTNNRKLHSAIALEDGFDNILTIQGTIWYKRSPVAQSKSAKDPLLSNLDIRDDRFPTLVLYTIKGLCISYNITLPKLIFQKIRLFETL